MKELPDEYTIRLQDMPEAVGGFISESPDGHVNVYLNARWGHNGQLAAADHEFDHWRDDDLHNEKSIYEVEDKKDLPPLLRACDLPRPGHRHDKAELLIQQERIDDYRNDWYLNADTYDE